MRSYTVEYMARINTVNATAVIIFNLTVKRASTINGNDLAGNIIRTLH